MTKFNFRRVIPFAIVATAFLMGGCSSVRENTHAYLGTPKYAETNPQTVQIFESEPKEQKVRLGEVVVAVEGKPAREEIEKKIKTAAAKLGADGAFVVYDRTHIFPVVYSDYWWGPTWVTQDSTRNIVAIAFKYK